jgi:PAS domain S-box-containing protein
VSSVSTLIVLYSVNVFWRQLLMFDYDQTDQELRLMFEATPTGMIVTDQEGIVTFVNVQIEKLFGYPRSELIGQPIEMLIPERSRAGHPALRDAFMTRPQTRGMGQARDLRGLRKDGTEFPVEIGLNPFLSGDRLLVVGSVVDITERKRHEEHICAIMNELSHRSKNLLMVVVAIANQTVRRATTFGEFQKHFENRLLAISRCHDLLVEKGWTGASIEALIFAQLRPFMDDPANRIDLAGPPIVLNPDAAQNIGLALHELATNAMKYGALSSPEGQIIIRWDIDEERTPKKFRMSWRERGGPQVAPPTHEGFGHKLLSRFASGTPDTQVELAFAPEGFVWSLECQEDVLMRQ